MAKFDTRCSSAARFGIQATRLATGMVLGLGVALPAMAQALRFDLDGPVSLTLVEADAEASSPETVRLLVGLGKIKADLQLGLLFLEDGLTNPKGSHFAHPMEAVWPEIKDGLLAAGAADLEPTLRKLAAGGGKEEVSAAMHEAEGAILKARAVLHPSGADEVLAILGLVRASADDINPSGPTEVQAYQSAWALLMVARGQFDLLARNSDPALAKLAVAESLAIDDVILSMPDPNQMAPVAFDPKPILDLIGRLEQKGDAA